MKSKAIILLGISLIGSFLGFYREIITAKYFGVSLDLEVFLIATTFSTLVLPRVSRAITASFIPLSLKYNRYDKYNEFEISIYNIVSRVSLYVTIIYFAIVLILFLLNLNDNNHKLYLMLLILTPTTYYILINGVQIGKFQAREKYFKPASAGLMVNFIMIFSIVLAGINLNIYIMVFGIVAYVILQYLYLKEGFISNVKDINYDIVISFWGNLKPTLLSAIAPVFPLFLIRYLSGFYEPGDIPAFNYAYLIMGFVPLLFAMSFLTVLTPKFSKVFLNRMNIKSFMNKVLFTIIIIILPIQIIIIYYSKELIELFFARGQFGNGEVLITSDILAILAIAILAVVLREILIRFSLATESSKKAFTNSLIYLILSFLLTLLGSIYYHIKGAAFSIIIVEYFSVILFLIRLNNYIHAKKIITVIVFALTFLCYLYINTN